MEINLIQIIISVVVQWDSTLAFDKGTEFDPQ